MQIEADFECGNIEVESLNGTEVKLRIRPDSSAAFYQWFYFRALGDESVRFSIVNAGGASYTPAWPEYKVLASYDGENWGRIPTTYDGTTLQFDHQSETGRADYAFFVPYVSAQREHLLSLCDAAPGVERRQIGTTLQGRPLEMVVFGAEARDALPIWIIARQHAGEPMAEYAAEGAVRSLLDRNDKAAQSLLAKATVYIVPNVNPDGSALGNLRANAAGVDLNRAWQQPHDQCPEVTAILNEMHRTGVAYFIDIHGDETREYLYTVLPGVELEPDIVRTIHWYEMELAKLNPEMQPEPVYITGTSATNSHPGMAVNHVAVTFNCPAWTPELPFKEPVPGHDTLLADGCRRFGRSCVTALDTIID